MQLVKDWQADKTKPNPYIVAEGKNAGPSEAQVAAKLKRAELKEAREGRGDFLEGATTATAFVKALLHLEDLKRRIKNEVRGTTSPSAEREVQIEELRVSFFKKLKTLRNQQEVFMPGVSGLQQAEEECRDTDRPPTKAEDVKLWLPSDLTEAQRGRASRAALSTLEAKLREAQCGDALSQMRDLLYTKTHIIHYRNSTSVGQRASTRSSTLISRVTDQIRREATKYRQARAALTRLMGAQYRPDLAELEDRDNDEWVLPGEVGTSLLPLQAGLCHGYGKRLEGRTNQHGYMQLCE
ncbi:CxC2 domain-containing protein [Mycena indigotica]|uniref:CxC2 domain-containing protein n=1 Tax=Mycena indigotica TaxID=2126181 RepID=A0A8H6SGV4_9AGAR|nr:CxC2 domain-containing protein [Mycena indigotica]KAF7299241.1 CxC2 domain-containing protein [Mycena indigotica]